MESTAAECSSEAAPSCSETAMKELARGHESAARLASLLLLDPGRPPPAMTGILVDEILGAITRAKAFLESSGDNQEGDQSPSADAASKGFRGKRKKGQSTGKAGYRRRGSPFSWTRVTSSMIDDGYSWRKYGQKDIFCSKYPRSYFRCSHKYDKGCMATRQVQKSETDPSLFVITYFGDHMCKAATTAVEAPPCRSEWSAKIAGFSESMAAGGEIKQETSSSSLPSDLKQESEEVDLSNLTSVSLPSDYFVLPEMEIKETVKVPSSGTTLEIGLDNGDILLGCGMEFMDLGDLVCFDHNLLYDY